VKVVGGKSKKQQGKRRRFTRKTRK
jgi:hypothetical protein